MEIYLAVEKVRGERGGQPIDEYEDVAILGGYATEEDAKQRLHERKTDLIEQQLEIQSGAVTESVINRAVAEEYLDTWFEFCTSRLDMTPQLPNGSNKD